MLTIHLYLTYMYIGQFFTLIPFLESDLEYLAGMFRFQARFQKMKTRLRQPTFRGVPGDVRSLLTLFLTIYVDFGYKTRFRIPRKAWWLEFRLWNAFGIVCKLKLLIKSGIQWYLRGVHSTTVMSYGGQFLHWFHSWNRNWVILPECSDSEPDSKQNTSETTMSEWNSFGESHVLVWNRAQNRNIQVR